jgi:protein-S-isoprenylcysteine O-methyltransferase Ste14
MPISFEAVISTLITVSVISVFVAVLTDFTLYAENNDVIKKKRSLVATGSMIAFFLVYYAVARLGIGTIEILNDALYYVLLSTGTLLILVGAAANILARLALKNNWSDHIKIYQDHRLMTGGVYHLVRHPMYASIMVMLLGGVLVYRNWLALLLTLLIFIPMMTYRARQEETLLEAQFGDYAAYRQNTGMFFPRIGGKRHEI